MNTATCQNGNAAGKNFHEKYVLVQFYSRPVENMVATVTEALAASVALVLELPHEDGIDVVHDGIMCLPKSFPHGSLGRLPR